MNDLADFWGVGLLFKIIVKADKYNFRATQKTVTFYVSNMKKQDAINYLTKNLKEGYTISKISVVGSQNSGVMWSNNGLRKKLKQRK